MIPQTLQIPHSCYKFILFYHLLWLTMEKSHQMSLFVPQGPQKASANGTRIMATCVEGSILSGTQHLGPSVAEVVIRKGFRLWLIKLNSFLG